MRCHEVIILDSLTIRDKHHLLLITFIRHIMLARRKAIITLALLFKPLNLDSCVLLIYTKTRCKLQNADVSVFRYNGCRGNVKHFHGNLCLVALTVARNIDVEES